MKPGNGGWVSRLAVKQDGVLSRLLLSTLILFLNADPSKGNQYYRFPYADLTPYGGRYCFRLRPIGQR